MKIVQNASPIDWSTFQYMVFDVPTHRGSYDERYLSLGTHSAVPLMQSKSSHTLSLRETSEQQRLDARETGPQRAM